MTIAGQHSAACVDVQTAPVWRAGFRPFYLLGPLFGVTALSLWAAGRWDGAGVLHGMPVWHAHEMLFGFAGALAGGFVLTAVPSWTGTPAVTGRPLAVLASVWLLGRLAVLLGTEWPAAALADLFYVPVLAWLAAPGVWRARNPLYRLLLAILAGLFAGNLLFHGGIAMDDPALAALGVHVALYGFMVLYSFVAGLLTPIFTETALRARGDSWTAIFSMPLEWAAALTVLAVAIADLGGLGVSAVAVAAGAAAVVHALRMARWRPLAVRDDPVMWPMHLGYAFFVLAFALLAFDAPASAAVHAFTVGAMGLTKLSLMTRVVLKHTGRPVRATRWTQAVYAAMLLAVAARLPAAWGVAPEGMLAMAAALWALSMGGFVALYGGMLVAPSLPYDRRG
ncbi:MAG TPA: NnrS family protein [Azospirillum sp.]|nr:NnrS family protein [Azospirillum sp.]